MAVECHSGGCLQYCVPVQNSPGRYAHKQGDKQRLGICLLLLLSMAARNRYNLAGIAWGKQRSLRGGGLVSGWSTMPALALQGFARGDTCARPSWPCMHALASEHVRNSSVPSTRVSCGRCPLMRQASSMPCCWTFSLSRCLPHPSCNAYVVASVWVHLASAAGIGSSRRCQ